MRHGYSLLFTSTSNLLWGVRRYDCRLPEAQSTAAAGEAAQKAVNEAKAMWSHSGNNFNIKRYIGFSTIFCANVPAKN
jgi:hypothetical protein